MKPNCSNHRTHAITRVEFLTVIITLGLLAILAAYGLTGAYRKFLVVGCASNLKQVALVYRIYADEHGGKFPVTATAGDAGSIGPVVWDKAAVVSNLFATPKLLHCPADRDRLMFSTGSDTRNFSYFTGLIADTNSPKAFLCGDDNFEMNSAAIPPGRLEFTADTSLRWSSARHNRIGNIALADGSIWEGINHSKLLKLAGQTGLATNRLFIP